MYEAKYIIIFNFSRGEVTLEVARRVNAREPMTSGQQQSIHFKKSTVVWIAGNIDLRKTAPQCHPPLHFCVFLSCVLCMTVNPWHGDSIQTYTLEKVEKGAK